MSRILALSGAPFIVAGLYQRLFLVAFSGWLVLTARANRQNRQDTSDNDV